ncbi:MAG TPA: hypothetical protein VHR72_00320 [Gemmataceae bacterium]|jgi:hypothetical protein|nr:hypothetical protein [Gemmataceae bacterium]
MMRKMLLAIAGLLVVAGAIGFRQAIPIRVWWAFRELRQAAPEDRDKTAASFATLGEEAVKPLLEGWNSTDSETCELSTRALLAAAAGLDDAATLRTLDAIRAGFDGFSVEGKRGALRLSATVSTKPGELSEAVAEKVNDIAKAAEKSAELTAMRLFVVGSLVGRGDRWTNAARTQALEAVADADVPTRVAAVKVLLHKPLAKERDVLVRLAPLLLDPASEVRGLVLMAVAESRDIVSDEQLLPLLHDVDPEVRRVCDVALRSRGLTDDQIHLARLISDGDPSVRIQVLTLIDRATDLDRETWLRLLTSDPAPAIRAAAARAARSVAPLRGRLTEMSSSDPSETVRDIARFWLDRTAIRRAGGE